MERCAHSLREWSAVDTVICEWSPDRFLGTVAISTSTWNSLHTYGTTAITQLSFYSTVSRFSPMSTEQIDQVADWDIPCMQASSSDSKSHTRSAMWRSLQVSLRSS